MNVLAFAAQHAPLLAIVVPLFVAPIVLMTGGRTFSFLLSWLAAAIAFALSLHLAFVTADGTVLSYALGGWAPPLGIEYRVDAANAFVMVIVSSVATVVLPYARATIDSDVERGHQAMFYALLMLC
ncbi:monovalent cation/H+ antiporter subunit D family protein, partial [Rhizobiaceae bacterium]|nr:monovalent cation/H+ antiporter subunit D family protein [Rhizobiaceae bacterium]